MDSREDDPINPQHYKRGPTLKCQPEQHTSRKLECIEVIRHITDFRLATAMKYIWRVAFGGKNNDCEDIEKAIWYLNDWLGNPR